MRRAVAATRAAHPAGIYATAVGKKYAMAISGIVLCSTGSPPVCCQAAADLAPGRPGGARRL